MISALRLSLLLALLVVAAYYVALHARVLGIAHPITQDEPGFVEITAAGNPYTHDGLLAGANVYGPGYALWARPFAVVINNPYIAHRWASTVALLLTLGLLGWILRREGVGGVETAAGLGIVYILNVSSHSLSASTDLLGAGFYLAALAVSRRGTWPALLGGAALAMLATLTKPYFALAAVIVATHLLAFAPPRRALAYLGVLALLALASAAVLSVVAPLYFLSTFVVQNTSSVRSLAILQSQTGEFALLAGGVILLALLHWPRRRTFAASLRLPPLSPALDLWDWATLVSATVLLTVLGWHPGNYLVYFYHLLLAPLVIVALRRLPAWPRLGRGLLIANLLVLGYLLPPPPGPDNWPALAASVDGVHGRILADPLLESLARTRPNVELFTHGQTASVLQALDHLGPAVPARYASLHRDLIRQADALNDRIRRRDFAAIYVSYQDIGAHSAWSYEQGRVRDTLFANYRLAGEVVVYPYATPYWNRLKHGQYEYHVTRWIPK